MTKEKCIIRPVGPVIKCVWGRGGGGGGGEGSFSWGCIKCVVCRTGDRNNYTRNNIWRRKEQKTHTINTNKPQEDTTRVSDNIKMDYILPSK